MKWLIILAVFIILILIIRKVRKNNSEESMDNSEWNIIDEGRKRGGMLGDCCKKFKNLFGGGA